ncbi:MAG: hypothetical protein B7Y88_11410 [Sphingomonadales bacterium 32-64-17]|nr:MAG: hypothetical protein B7Y88_11410 [Sphingomonadales bacterium 32-64-17]
MRPIFAIMAAFGMAFASPAAAHTELSQQQVDELARDVSRVESVRAVKDLQRFYAQYAQFGLWQEMADLFADDAEMVWAGQSIRGKQAITQFLQDYVGGQRGLRDGAVFANLIEEPLVNLAVDGTSAKGRWMGLLLAGNGSGESRIEGGVYENGYTFQDGVWKISRLEYFPQYEGDYANGWANYRNEQLAIFPFHFTLDESGMPIPPAQGNAPTSHTTLAALETRIAALNAEDQVRNLQNSYGYYVDRKMWADVVDLFTADGVVEIEGVGRFEGPEGIRQAMELFGPEGLRDGDLNDFPSFDTVITLAEGKREAYSRGFALGMLGDHTAGTAGWEFQVFRNRFVLDQGLWKIREMRLYPLLKATYADGWAAGGTSHLTRVLPAFTEPHPITGEAVTISGFREAGATPLLAPIEAEAAPAAGGTPAERLITAQRRLARSSAYDGVVNVSSAYGYYIDEFHWKEMAGLFAEQGNKHSPFAGFYLGKDRVQAAATTMWGEPPTLRDGISFHWRFQPVIHVSHDGRSANLRTRLFQPRTGLRRSDGGQNTALNTPGFNTGMYPNDQAVLENGIWRLWSLTIDEHYMTSANWNEGWAGVEPVSSEQAAGQSPLVERLPPDILMTDLGRRAEHFRGGTGQTIAWPGILPMWFHYKNPVSGRVPERYWPDSVPGLDLPEARLVSHGYQMPPNGPEQDGIHIELTPPEANVMQGD